MKEYLANLAGLVADAKLYPDRTGAGRWRMFGGDNFVGMETYNLKEGLPMVTTKEMFVRNMIVELLGFLHGKTDAESLNGSFWKRWAVDEGFIEKKVQEAVDELDESQKFKTPEDEEAFRNSIRRQYDDCLGSIGPMYGAMWRRFPRVSFGTPWWFEGYADIPSDVIPGFQEDFLREVALSNGTIKNDQETWEKYAIQRYVTQGYDQLAMVMKGLKTRPYSSRHRVTALHPDLVGPEFNSAQENVINGFGALAPCHQNFQFLVTNDNDGNKELNCMLYMSSSDFPLGRPYNIAQYALLTMMMAHCLDYQPGRFTIVSCDTHVYDNQKVKTETQLRRAPLPRPQVVFNSNKKDLFAFTVDDISVVNYQHHERLNYAANV